MNDFNTQVEQNLATILQGSSTFTPTTAPTAARRKLQNCNGTIPLSVMLPSYGLTEAQILAAVQAATPDQLFTTYSGQVCSYDIKNITTVDTTLAPTTRQCVFPCMANYIPDRLKCLQQDFLMPKVQCVLAAKQKRKACLFKAITTLCIF